MSELLLTVDTSQLSEGMEVKNYKALCQLVGEQAKTGNAKKSQMKEWERFFAIEKVKGSQKMRITEIYNRPKAKEDKRLDGVYAKSIEMILLYELEQCKGYTAYFTKNQLLHLLGMVNKNYKRLTNSELKNIDYSISDFEINHFYQRVDARLTGILKSALTSLKRRWVVESTEQYMIVDARNNRRIAEDIDIQNIMTLKKKVANLVGCDSEKDVFLKMKTAEFYKLLNYYYSYHFGWKYVYKQYKLIFNRQIVVEEIPKVEKELQRELLNCNIVSALNQGATQNYTTSKKRGFRLPSMYVKAQSLLTDKLVKIEANDTQDTGDEVRQGKIADDEFVIDLDMSDEEQAELNALFGMS